MSSVRYLDDPEMQKMTPPAAERGSVELLGNSHSSNSVEILRLPVRIDRDVRRVILTPFEVNLKPRVAAIFEQVLQLDEATVRHTLQGVFEAFQRRHRHFEQRLEEHFRTAAALLHYEVPLPREYRLLIGAYFTMEYSLEAAALFNPSIVPHPDQTDLPAGAQRFIMSLRAVGEGHISSAVFLTGVVFENLAIALDPPRPFPARTRIKPDQLYDRRLFRRKLFEIGAHAESVDKMLQWLPDRFTFEQLEQAIHRATKGSKPHAQFNNAVSAMLSLARSNYQLELEPGEQIADLVLFPRSATEARGIEDLRLARFHDEDGGIRYFATYTAFDGLNIYPMLLETEDWRVFSIHTLNGACAQNKGMALFPRRIDGHYCMCSRIDGRNLYLMFSDYVHFWESASLLAKPKYPWELRLIGNGGSPLETPEGWLLLTHGVGPMRVYSLGAMLLDLKDPFRIQGRLKEPLIKPLEEERSGYVPNVVYSCGALIHGNYLILPYAVSDTLTRIAAVRLDQLIDRLLRDGP